MKPNTLLALTIFAAAVILITWLAVMNALLLALMKYIGG